MLEVGTKFPEFALPNQENKTRHLADYAGKWLVLYVYPKDDTPGCTIQGKSFTASQKDYDAVGIQVVGISADDVASHRSFCGKFGLTVELLADPEATLLKKMGGGQAEWKGTMYWNRTTFVINPQGTLCKVYEKVNPQGHEQILLDDIRALQAAKK